MQIKWLRNALIGTTGIAVAMMVAVGAWVLFGGTHEVPKVIVPALGQPSTAIPSTITANTAKSFDRLWNLSLQEPRNAPSIQTGATVVSQAGKGFGIKLVGTMIDASESLALFCDDRWAFDLKGVGQTLELTPPGVQIASIEPGLATLRHGGTEMHLRLDAGVASAQSSAALYGASNSAQPNDENPDNVTQREPVSSMSPMSPADAVPPEGKEDIFAPLPENMDPTRIVPLTSPGAPMEARP